MQFLIFFQDKKLGIYFKYLFENTFSCEVRLVESLEDFQQELSKINDYSFCLYSSDDILNDSNLSKLETSMSRTPGLCVCQNKYFQTRLAKVFINKNITLINNLANVQQLLNIVADKLGMKYEVNEFEFGFLPIRQEYLLKIDRIECDIFIKLSDEKYLKLFKQGSEVTSKEILRVQKKNIDFLYVRINEFENFLNSINAYESDYSNLPTREANLHIAEDLSFSNDLFYQFSSNFGLNQKAVVFANRSIELLHQLIDQDESLQSFWKLLMMKKNFLSEHSLMVGYLSNAILSHTSHSNENNAIKLSLAALIHDVGIKNEKYWEIELAEDSVENFTKREIESYRGHIQIAIDVLNKLEDAPPDIDKILMNHHEKYDGSGYPRGIGWSKIPFFAAVFIVAHEFVIHMYKNNCTDEELLSFIQLKKTEYLEGTFKEVILALEKIR
ncbi:MAG: HD domain-containing phosphohydrolase [Bacteriovorax sp.]|nr:HD domain-containing phosphohydrolase [Bacteriovorax sp.]